MNSMRLCFVLAFVLFAHVCEINGAAKLGWLRGKSAGAAEVDSEEPTELKVLDTENSDEGAELGKQVQAALDEATKKDPSAGRLFMKKLLLFGSGTSSTSQQPTIIPIIITSGSSSSGSTVTSTGTISGTGTVTTSPAARYGSDVDENEYYIEEEDAPADDEMLEDESKAQKKKNQKKNKNNVAANAMKNGITFQIPQQYRKYFNNQKSFTIPANMVQKATRGHVANGSAVNAGNTGTAANNNKSGNFKRRIVKRRPVRKNN